VKKVGFIYDDIFLRHVTPDWHPERKERLVQIVSSLKKSGLWENLIRIKPRRATYEEIALVHTDDYISRIKTSGVGYLDPDTYMS